jgi:ADP-heptose:LPS heptosyltransferase
MVLHVQERRQGYGRKVKRKITSALQLATFHLFLGGLYVFFLMTGRRRSPLSVAQPKSILVTELAAVGDIVLASAALRELRAAFPESRITLVVQRGVENLVEACPHIDNLLIFDRPPMSLACEASVGSIKVWVSVVRFAWKSLIPLNSELAVSSRIDVDSLYGLAGMLNYASGATRRVGYAIPQSQRVTRLIRNIGKLLTDELNVEPERHEALTKLHVVRYLAAAESNSKLELWISSKDALFARELCQSSTSLVTLAPATGSLLRQWPATRFVELGMWLQQTYHCKILIIGRDADRGLCAQIGDSLDSSKTVNLAGKTTLGQLSAILMNSSLFIGSDSGPMHMAAAAQVPIVALFGPGNIRRFSPWKTRSEVLSLGLFCSPCSENCIFDKPYCMDIGVEAVKNAVRRLKAATATFGTDA